MYSQNYLPVVDNVMYPVQQQQQQQQQQHYQPSLQLPSHSQQHKLPSPLYTDRIQKEPLPSATDDKPNIVLSTSEIAEFSSTMVYLMWHARRQSVMELHSNSKSNYMAQTNTSLEQTKVTADMANMTSTAFKKFCRQILSATQLSESVVLLSLKYIAMLLQNSPNIQGADGSEYRLFTVALMLANKFLDDNTFTNKTWSEVSGMKVIDLNIMELEFLDVLRFRLSVKKEEYERWRTALFNFRNQLMSVPAEIQRQKLMETMALSVGNNQQWMQQQQQIKQQQQQLQQHAAAVAAVTHNFFLFSKSQQQYPVQPTFNGPLTRVPLRIPTQPVYHNLRNTTNTTPSTNPIYDTTTTTTNNNNNNTNSQQHIINSNRRQAPLPTSITNTDPMYTSYHVPSSSTVTNRTSMSKVSTPYSQISPFNQPSQPSYTNKGGYQVPITPNISSTRASHRTSSLPQTGGLDLSSVKNSSYYYTPPTSTTPTTVYNNNSYSTTSYYVDPTITNAPTVLSTGQSDYNPYNNDVYNRPMIPRSSSYKNVPPPITPKGHDFTPKAVYNGPTLEDPLTAADSYRAHR